MDFLVRETLIRAGFPRGDNLEKLAPAVRMGQFRGAAALPYFDLTLAEAPAPAKARPHSTVWPEFVRDCVADSGRFVAAIDLMKTAVRVSYGPPSRTTSINDAFDTVRATVVQMLNKTSETKVRESVLALVDS